MYLFAFFFFFFVHLLFLILFLENLVLVTTGILGPSHFLSGKFAACLSTLNGTVLPLMALVDLYGGVPAYFRRNCEPGGRKQNCNLNNLIFEVYY